MLLVLKQIIIAYQIVVGIVRYDNVPFTEYVDEACTNCFI